MKNILYIDTSNSEKIQVAIEVDGKKYEKLAPSKQAKSQMILPMIEELLKEKSLKLSDLTEINVNTGPGSFTGLRVGIAVAQMLAKILNIPVNNKSSGSHIEPTY